MTDVVGARRSTEQVFETLRSEILSGHLPGGLPLREQEIAARLGVSRTPVREAVGRLVAEGLLVKRENMTAHVFHPSPEELLEIYQIRIPLESTAVRLACEESSPEYLTRLRAASEALEAATRLDNLDSWVIKHEEFHLALFETGRRPRLEGLVRTLRAQSEPYVRFAIAVQKPLRAKSAHGDAKLLALVEAGDARGVEALAKANLQRTSKRVTALLQSYQATGLAQPRSEK